MVARRIARPETLLSFVPEARMPPGQEHSAMQEFEVLLEVRCRVRAPNEVVARCEAGATVRGSSLPLAIGCEVTEVRGISAAIVQQPTKP